MRISDLGGQLENSIGKNLYPYQAEPEVHIIVAELDFCLHSL